MEHYFVPVAANLRKRFFIISFILIISVHQPRQKNKWLIVCAMRRRNTQVVFDIEHLVSVSEQEKLRFDLR